MSSVTIVFATNKDQTRLLEGTTVTVEYVITVYNNPDNYFTSGAEIPVVYNVLDVCLCG